MLAHSSRQEVWRCWKLDLAVASHVWGSWPKTNKKAFTEQENKAFIKNCINITDQKLYDEKLLKTDI